jgi:hypothetical protein
MLYTQSLEKLSAMRLEGMAQALERQRRQSDISSLDFEARLVIERQWLWKENRALAPRLHYAKLKLSASLEDGVSPTMFNRNGEPKLWEKHREIPMLLIPFLRIEIRPPGPGCRRYLRPGCGT